MIGRVAQARGPLRVVPVAGNPHLHIHFLTPDDVWDRTRVGACEYVCHACAVSLEVWYQWPMWDVKDGTSYTLQMLLEKFISQHANCRSNAPHGGWKCTPHRVAVQEVRWIDIQEKGSLPDLI
jgi:hypothetical protein